MPARRYPDWETFEYFHQPDAGDGLVAGDGPVAFGAGPVALDALRRVPAGDHPASRTR